MHTVTVHVIAMNEAIGIDTAIATIVIITITLRTNGTMIATGTMLTTIQQQGLQDFLSQGSQV